MFGLQVSHIVVDSDISPSHGVYWISLSACPPDGSLIQTCHSGANFWRDEMMNGQTAQPIAAGGEATRWRRELLKRQEKIK